MKIGYVMLYPYRGSIQNMIYLKKLMEVDGNESFFLTCDAAVPFCYNRMIKGNSKLKECPKCILGGIRSFGVKQITSIDSKLKKNLSEVKLRRIVESTSYSLHRIETDDDCLSDEVLITQASLCSSAAIVYANAEKWINENKIDALIIFNGRLDLPSAVIHVCKDNNIPYITFEAAYPGIALNVNEDCRGLNSLNKIVEEYKNKPLTDEQAKFAGKIATQMLLKKNMVWRLYNTNPTKGRWNSNAEGKKVLIVPSSNHEFKGAKDWTSNWSNMSEALDTVLEKLNINYSQCVIRNHPNWSDKIGINETGYKSERFYLNWAKDRNVSIIMSNDTVNTNDLISEADIIIVQGGTAGIESGLLGKMVIGLIPSWYSNADFSIQVHGREDIYKLDDLSSFSSDQIISKTLRFLYVYHKRLAQYSNYVKPTNIHTNDYFIGGDAKNIIDALRYGYIVSDDKNIAENCIEENKIIDLIKNKQWDDLLNFEEINYVSNEMKIERILCLRWLDRFRAKFKSGDR